MYNGALVLATVIISLLAVAACSSSAPAPAPAPTPNPPPAHPSPPPTPPAESADSEIVARVVDSGPVGHGDDCTQCSFQIVVEEHFTGDIETSTTPIWVHYERCRSTPAPTPPPEAIDPCSMDRNTLYVLTLRRGSSPNFGNDPMIQTARPRPIE